jgi:hypothetical protein
VVVALAVDVAVVAMRETVTATNWVAGGGNYPKNIGIAPLSSINKSISGKKSISP